jgi:hypothetical protein
VAELLLIQRGLLRSWVPPTKPLRRSEEPLPSKLLVTQVVLVVAAAALAHRTTQLRTAKLGIPPLYQLATWWVISCPV